MVCTGPNNRLTLNALEATDDVMVRVAHLACCSESRACLNHIFGPKSAREAINDHDLYNDQLWADLAAQFVNNPKWEFSHIHVPQLDYKQIMADGSEQTLSKIDATKCQRPGITGDTCKAVFKSIQSDYHKLSGAVNGRTGCNSAEPMLYSVVWNNYICGPKAANYFPRPAVAMYVFKLWDTAEKRGSLPHYCLKTLKPEAAVRAGVTGCSDSASNATTPSVFAFNTAPRTPRGSGSGSGQSSLLSPDSTVGLTGSSIQAIDKLVNYWENRRAASDAAQIQYQKPPAPPPPEPDHELDCLIRKHKLWEFWKCVNLKLHVETVAELAMIEQTLLDEAVPLSEFPAAVK
jgi:hypothetical protein